MILGGGPNRIGQGIEFDYCCVHASFACREEGYESIMVNCNPETVSTDYDTSDRLYFEPLTLEDVLGIVDREQPKGVIVQFGGQTPLNLAIPLQDAGVPILGTSPDAIDRAEDRKRFSKLITKLGLRQPPNGTSRAPDEAIRIAHRLGYPVLVRPSYVLGGRAMEIVYTDEELKDYMNRAVMASPQRPVLVDKFLEDAAEIDVDAVSRRRADDHLRRHGTHRGGRHPQRRLVLRPAALYAGREHRRRDRGEHAAPGRRPPGPRPHQRPVRLARRHGVRPGGQPAGLAHGAVRGQGDRRAVGHGGHQGHPRQVRWRNWASRRKSGPRYSSVKSPVFPWSRFPGVDPVLGPEMKSTGEVMGIDPKFGVAFAKSQIAAGNAWAPRGRVFVSVNNHDKRDIVGIAKRLVGLGFTLTATHGTAAVLRTSGLEVEELPKVQEGARPNVVDRMKNGDIAFLINTPSGRRYRPFEVTIRATAVRLGVPLVTTLSGAAAVVLGLEEMARGPLGVRSLQEYQNDLVASRAK